MVRGDNNFINTANGSQPPLWHDGLAFIGGLAALAAVIGAPVLAVNGMRSGRPSARKLSYLAFAVAAGYWEIFAIALVKHTPGS